MSAKVDLEKFAADLTARLNRSISINSLKRLGDYALRVIKERVRAGYGVRESGGRIYKFSRLAPSTIKQRKRMRLSPFTTPSTSNATRTGKMIGGLRVTTRTGLIQIQTTGEATNYIGFYSEKRPFLNLSKDETDDLAKFYEREILDLTGL